MIWSLRSFRIRRIVHFLKFTSTLKINAVCLISQSRLLNPLKSSWTNDIWVIHIVVAWKSRVSLSRLCPFDFFILLKNIVMNWSSNMPFTLSSRNVGNVHCISNEPWRRFRHWNCWNIFSLLHSSWLILHIWQTFMSLICRKSSIDIGVLLISYLHN